MSPLRALGLAAGVFSLVLATPVFAAAPTAALSSQLATARMSCERSAAARLGAAASVASAAAATRELVGKPACPGLSRPDPPPEIPDLLDAIAADLDARTRDYGCAGAATLPECQGLARARERLADLRLFQVGDTATIDALPPGRYSRQQAYVWLRDRVSFGEGPAAGTSLLRLVLEASAPDTPLTRRVHPDVWWTDVRDEVDAASAQTCIDRCLTSVIRVISLYPDFDALDTALQLTTKGNYEATLTQLEGVVGRWQAYHFGGGEGRAQLPWELVVNSWIYSQNRDDRIWHEPPHGALILAHPSPGLALTDTHGKAVILNVVELLGYSRWGYDPKTYSRKNEWGLSAIASYRQRADARDWNFGALVRTPINIAGLPLNVAWSRSRLKAGGHDDLVAISVDISRYLPKINADCLSHLPSCVAGRN